MTSWMFVVALSLGAEDPADSEAKAQEAIAAKRFAEARRIYDRLLEQDPLNGDWAIRAARVSAWLGDRDDAIRRYDSVLAREPRNYDAMLAKAQVLISQRRFAESAPLLNQVEAVSSSDADLHLARARLYLGLRETRAALRSLDRALALAPGYAEARDLKERIVPSPTVEVAFGYARDQFNFTGPANMGSIRADWVGEVGRIGLDWESWDRFDRRTHRAGVHISRRFRERWSARASALAGTRNDVLAAADYSAGITRALPKGWVAGADYRHLRFQTATVNVLSPSVEYYFRRPFWIQSAYYRTLTRFHGASFNSGSDSFLVQWHYQLHRAARIRVGYAHGNESFVGLSVDRLGRFDADTWIVGGEWKRWTACSLAGFYAHQQRSGGRTATSFGTHVTFRR